MYTPSHNPIWLDACFESLKRQTFRDWEWIVVLNGGATWQPDSDSYPVRVLEIPQSMGVGEAKSRACDWAEGSILLELDHDDILSPDALEEVADAFDRNPEAVLVYSYWTQVQEDGSPDPEEFDPNTGWEYRTGLMGDQSVKYAVALPPTPHNVSYIWYAPNHVRAFRKDAYDSVGGYDRGLDILDDQDLMCRLYQAGEFVLIEKCLYAQRMHAQNTHRDAELNSRIQRETVALYDKYFEANYQAWSKRRDLQSIEVSRSGPRSPGYVRYLQPGSGDELVQFLRETPTSSVGLIKLQGALSLIDDAISLFNELHRVLAPGGAVVTATLSTDGRGAFQDPLARSYWNENSFWYFAEDVYRKDLPDLVASFQVSRSVTTFPSQWHEERLLSYVFVNLLALSPGDARHGGRLLASPRQESVITPDDR